MDRSIGRAILAGGLALPLVAAGPARADDASPESPPFVGEGELSFFVDLAAFRSTTGFTEQEIYVAVSNDQLVFQGEEGSSDESEPPADGEPGDVAGRDDAPAQEPTPPPLEGEIRLEVRLRTEDGDEVASLDTPLRPQAASRLDSRDHGILQVIREHLAVAPGVYHLEVTLTDLRSQKVGLFNRMRKARNRGNVEAWIAIPAFEETGLALSDLALVRNARAAKEGPGFGRHGVDFDPNPSRYYGLVLPNVKYYLEVYPGAAYAEGDPFLILSQVRDLSGVPLAERRSRAVPVDGAFVVTDAVNLEESIPAGRYELNVVLMNERTRESARVERPFDVMWAVTSWGQDPNRLLQEMALIMTDSEYDVLEQLAPGAREVYLAEFWHGLDPTPDTPRNEILDRFQERIRLADRNYAQTLRRGVLTDRGRVLVRYGAPDEVDYQYSSSGFGPDAGSQRVSEPGERADLSNRPAPSFLSADEFREGDVSGLATQRGGATIKSKQLEVWTYDGWGSPLRPDHQDLSNVSHRGLKFIFADEMGNGEYQLVGSEGATVY